MRMLMRIVLPAVLLSVLASCGSRAQTIEIGAGETVLTVEVAKTTEDRSRGLMYRKSLPENSGMLFVYDRDQNLSFWMKNTEIPLSIAFISRDGTIREIRHMQPFSEEPVVSEYAVRYALEVPQGTFERIGVGAGDRLRLPDTF